MKKMPSVAVVSVEVSGISFLLRASVSNTAKIVRALRKFKNLSNSKSQAKNPPNCSCGRLNILGEIKLYIKIPNGFFRR